MTITTFYAVGIFYVIDMRYVWWAWTNV